MTDTVRTRADDRPTDGQVDAVMLAARVLIAVTARSVAAVEDRVTLPQLRVLVVIASRGPTNVGAIARGLDVHASNVTRTCDRLVGSGLLRRYDDPSDRRNLVLELTAAGQQLVDGVNAERRAAIEDLLASMPAPSRRSLASALLAFAGAAGTTDDTPGAWVLGWTTEQPVGSPAGHLHPH